MKKDETYLKHIRDSISKIEKYTNGFSREIFLDDDKTQDAVIRQIEIIGEASRNVSDNFKLSYKEVPWRIIIGMRNRLIHDYFGVNVEAVWKVVNEDIPELKEQINEIFSKL